jgi:hypothetical protein
MSADETRRTRDERPNGHGPWVGKGGDIAADSRFALVGRQPPDGPGRCPLGEQTGR